MNHALIKLSALIGLLTLPLTAHADLFSMYVSGKGAYATGSSNAFDHLDSTMGAGAEAGIELLHVDIWGEALNMGADQYYFTANLGFDVTFGKKWRCNMGFYTGPVLFMRPEQTSEPFALSGTMRSALSAAGIDPTMVESQYHDAQAQEDELSRYALGWNLGRARLEFERELVPMVFLGVGGQVSYHMMLTGAEVAADAKNTVVDDIDTQYQLSSMDPNLSSDLRKELGAKELNTEKLGGVNVNVGAYLKVEI